MTSPKTELLASAATVGTEPFVSTIEPEPADNLAPVGFEGDQTPTAFKPEKESAAPITPKINKKKARAPPESPDRIVSEAECQEITGLSRATRWRGMRQGWFPSSIELSPRRKGWRLSEILAWKASRKRSYPSEEAAA